MCGSGTFGIEGLLWARRIAPGLLRGEDPGFGYRNWPSYGQAELEFDRELQAEARARILPEGPAVLLADRSADAVALARENIREAGLVGIRYEVQPFEPTLSGAPERPFVIANPPYGERLEADAALYADLGAALRDVPGARFGVLAGSRDLAMAMRLRWDTELPVKNGQLLVGFVAGDIADPGATMRRDEGPSRSGPRPRRV
jgi:23S rRNA (guanine2445-N2)-methyltransferase / 23S rRNA (guanine2069-N7)-methyltransferase